MSTSEAGELRSRNFLLPMWIALAAILVIIGGLVLVAVLSNTARPDDSLAKQWGYPPPPDGRVSVDESSSGFTGDGSRIQAITSGLTGEQLASAAKGLGTVVPLTDCSEIDAVLAEIENNPISCEKDLLHSPSLALRKDLDRAWLVFKDGQVVLIEECI